MIVQRKLDGAKFYATYDVFKHKTIIAGKEYSDWQFAKLFRIIFVS